MLNDRTQQGHRLEYNRFPGLKENGKRRKLSGQAGCSVCCCTTHDEGHSSHHIPLCSHTQPQHQKSCHTGLQPPHAFTVFLQPLVAKMEASSSSLALQCVYHWLQSKGNCGYSVDASGLKHIFLTLKKVTNTKGSRNTQVSLLSSHRHMFLASVILEDF